MSSKDETCHKREVSSVYKVCSTNSYELLVLQSSVPAFCDIPCLEDKERNSDLCTNL